MEAALDGAASGSGSILVVEGPAGIGKTELLHAAGVAAAERGARLMQARGGELERDFPFAVVRQLFDPVAWQADTAVLSGAASLARQVLGAGGARPGMGSGDLAPVLHGLYWLVSNLAEAGPLVLVVDDAHWADEPSLAFCHYLARRLQHLPVVLALAERRPEAGIDQAVLARIMLEPDAVVLRPDPLSPAAVAHLVHGATADADEEFCAAVHAASGGNPLLVGALLQEVQRVGLQPVAAQAHRVAELAPDVVARSLSARLARLPVGCLRLAEAVSVLGPNADPGLAQQLAELDQDKAAICTDALAGAGILASARPLEFFHPLLRQATYAQLPPGQRSLLHQRAARLLDDAGATPAAVAAHLLATDPAADPWRAGILRAAGRDAMAGGVPQGAVTFLERAVAEPPAPGERADVLVELGFAHGRAAHVPEALAVLDRALRLGLDPRRRIEAGIVLARMVGLVRMDHAAAAEILDELQGELVSDDLSALIALERARLLVDVRGAPVPQPDPEDVRQLADRLAGSRRAAALGVYSLLGLLSGEPAEAMVSVAEQALGAWFAEPDEGWPHEPCYTLIFADACERALHVLGEFMAAGQRVGSPFLYGAPLVWRGHLLYRMGRLADAEADCQAVRDIILELDDGGYAVGMPNFVLASIALARGQTDEADRYLAEVQPASWGHITWFLDARARVRTVQGRLDEALEDLYELAGKPERSPSWLSWRSSLALTLHSGGERAEALRWAEEEVQLARAQGIPRALGIALRTLGLVEGGQEGLAHLREAVGVLATSPAVLEHAHGLFELGAALRRARRPKDAREPLRQAVDLAHRCGATALVERARQELAAAGAKPRRLAVTGVDALTPSERRVAQLAAQGMTNKEIAQSLFVSAWTIASQLASTYQKLQISGRAELAATLPPAGGSQAGPG